jgi:predicted CoA-substrate-specific enzyme activase
VITAGVDVGSVNTKLVVLDHASGTAICERVEPTGPKPRETARRVLDDCRREHPDLRGRVEALVATGYARNVVDGAGSTITEIKAAALGIRLWHPDCRTVVDIGGQDSKVLALDEAGRVADFAMNDRCAAGTGHFLSVLARTLSVPLEDFGRMGLAARRPVPVSSLCVVMAESEILSLLAADTPVEDIIAGLHEALARRVANMAARLKVGGQVVFTGGVAQDEGMRAALENVLGLPVACARKPLLAAATGAALASARTPGA